MSFFQRLSQEYPGLSKGQKKIADYLLQFPEEASWRPIAHVARQTGVSEASVVRFVYAFGYKGYKEMQQDLHAEVYNRLSIAQRFKETVESGSAEESICSQIYQKDIENMSNTYQNIPQENFEKARDMILKARKIGVVGTRVAVSPAVILQMLLNQLRDDVYLFTPSFDAAYDHLINWGEEDLLISFSYMKARNFVYDLSSFGREKGCKIIGICDNYRNAVSSISDLMLPVATEGAFLSMTSTMYVLDVILHMVSTSDESVSTGKLAAMDDIFDRFINRTVSTTTTKAEKERGK